MTTWVSKLCAGVLESAMSDLKEAPHEYERRRAMKWLMNDDDEQLLISFGMCMDTLHLSPTMVRRMALNIKIKHKHKAAEPQVAGLKLRDIAANAGLPLTTVRSRYYIQGVRDLAMLSCPSLWTPKQQESYQRKVKKRMEKKCLSSK